MTEAHFSGPVIGGSFDGRQQSHGARTFATLLRPQKLPCVVSTQCSGGSEKIEYEVYRWETIRTESREHGFWRHESLSLDQAVNCLMLGYCAATPDKVISEVQSALGQLEYFEFAQPTDATREFDSLLRPTINKLRRLLRLIR